MSGGYRFGAMTQELQGQGDAEKATIVKKHMTAGALESMPEDRVGHTLKVLKELDAATRNGGTDYLKQGDYQDLAGILKEGGFKANIFSNAAVNEGGDGRTATTAAETGQFIVGQALVQFEKGRPMQDSLMATFYNDYQKAAAAEQAALVPARTPAQAGLTAALENRAR